MTNNQSLGQRLREWREAHGLSVDDVAPMIGYHALTVEWIEREPKLGGDIRLAVERLIAAAPPWPVAAPACGLSGRRRPSAAG